MRSLCQDLVVTSFSHFCHFSESQRPVIDGLCSPVLSRAVVKFHVGLYQSTCSVYLLQHQQSRHAQPSSAHQHSTLFLFSYQTPIQPLRITPGKRTLLPCAHSTASQQPLNLCFNSTRVRRFGISGAWSTSCLWSCWSMMMDTRAIDGGRMSYNGCLQQEHQLLSMPAETRQNVITKHSHSLRLPIFDKALNDSRDHLATALHLSHN